MKKILALMLLTLGALALTAPTALAQATQKKEIKDQAEYNAYVAAIQATDINAKISGLEAFSQAYPNSVVRERRDGSSAAGLSADEQRGQG